MAQRGAGPGPAGGQQQPPFGGRGAPPPTQPDVLDTDSFETLADDDVLDTDTFETEAEAPAKDERSLERRFVSGAVNALNPMPLLREIFAPDGQGLQRVGAATLEAHKDQFKKAKELYDLSLLPDQSWVNRRLLQVQAFGHISAAVLPLFGPAAANSGELIGTGDAGNIAEGLGGAAGMILPTVKGVRARTTGAVERAVTPRGQMPASQAAGLATKYGAELPGLTARQAPRLASSAAAAQLAAERRMPMTRGEASQNPALLGLERAAEKTTAVGSMSAGPQLRGQQAAAMGRIGREMAEETGAPPTSPEQAGVGARQAARDINQQVGDAYGRTAQKIQERVAPGPGRTPVAAGESLVGAVENRVDALKGRAREHYDAFDQIANDPANAKEVVVGHEVGHMGDNSGFTLKIPIKETIASPIDLEATNMMDTFRRVNEEWTTQWPEIRKQQSAAFSLLASIVNSKKTIVPLAQAEKLLGYAKALARDEGGTAKLLVSKLQQAVDRGVAELGPDAQVALTKGRAAARIQWQANEVLAALKGTQSNHLTRGAQYEPVRAIGKITGADDKAITLLRRTAEEVPDAIPVVARQVLDDILSEGLTGGTLDFAKTKAMASAWNKLGDATKAILFKEPQVRQQIDAFFKQATRRQKSPTAPELRGTEGMAAFDALLRPRDASAGALRAIERVTRDPETGVSPVVQKLARAKLDSMVDRAVSEVGKFNHAKALAREWRNMGPATKRLLYGDNVKNLDAYFQLMEDINFEPNPSGTAYSLVVNGKIGAALALPASLFFDSPLGTGGSATANLVSIGHEALAKLLLSPRTAKPLLTAMKTPKANIASSARSVTALVAAAKAEGIDLLKGLPATIREALRAATIADESMRVAPEQQPEETSPLQQVAEFEMREVP